jgi:hypothetical protein
VGRPSAKQRQWPDCRVVAGFDGLTGNFRRTDQAWETTPIPRAKPAEITSLEQDRGDADLANTEDIFPDRTNLLEPCFTIPCSGVPALILVRTSAKQKPMLDESSFQQLLEALYVVQQHNDDKKSAPRLDHVESPPSRSIETAQVLAQVADLGCMLRAGAFDVVGTERLITDRLLEMLEAAGVSLSVVTDGYLDCVAESGAAAKIPGSSIASHSLVATERLKAGAVFDSRDTQTDIRLDIGICTKLGVGSLIAAPVFRFGELSGLIEARWTRARTFDEAELAACRLMATFVSGLLERRIMLAEPGSASAAIASESIVGLGVGPPSVIASELEARAVETRPQESEASSVNGQAAESDATSEIPAQPKTTAESCRICGHSFTADELFCGRCSMPRLAAAPGEGLQSKWAALWYLQQSKAGSTQSEGSTAGGDRAHWTSQSTGSRESVAAPSFIPPLEPGVEPLAARIAARTQPPRYRAALRRMRVRDVMLLLVTASLTFGVISAWPVSPNRPTWLESAMVRLGLRDAPPQITSHQGNPEVSVWVDSGTSRYYCPGSNLYGKTGKGEFLTQIEAQQKHFEPGDTAGCE